MLTIVSDGAEIEVTAEELLALIRTGQMEPTVTARRDAEPIGCVLGSGATSFLRPVLAPQGAPSGNSADTVARCLAAATSCPTGFVSLLSATAAAVLVCVDGQVRCVICSPSPPSLALMAVHYRRLQPGQANEDDDGDALLAKGLMNAATVASLEMARAVVGLSRVLRDSECTIVAVADEVARLTPAALPALTIVTDLAQRALKQWPEEMLRGSFGLTADATVAGTSEVVGLAPREATLCAMCADLAPCTVESLLPGASAGERARVDQLASLALLVSVGAIRLSPSTDEAPFSVPAQDWPARMPTAVMELAVVFTRPPEMTFAAAMVAAPQAVLPLPLPPTPKQKPKPKQKSTAAASTSTSTSTSPWPEADIAPWMLSFETYVHKRARALSIDANDGVNRDALETEYLEVTVNAGIAARDWMGVLPLAERWVSKAASDPGAWCAVGWARYRVASTPTSQAAALAAVDQQSARFASTFPLQALLGNLAIEQNDLALMRVALRRIKPLAPNDPLVMILTAKTKHEKPEQSFFDGLFSSIAANKDAALGLKRLVAALLMVGLIVSVALSFNHEDPRAVTSKIGLKCESALIDQKVLVCTLAGNGVPIASLISEAKITFNSLASRSITSIVVYSSTGNFLGSFQYRNGNVSY